MLQKIADLENANKFWNDFVLGVQSILAPSGELVATGSGKSSHYILEQLIELMKAKKVSGGGVSSDKKATEDVAVDTEGDSPDKAGQVADLKESADKDEVDS